MTSQRIAQTNQPQKSEKSQGSGILQRAAVRSVADAEMESTDDQEELALSNSAFSKDFSQVPISTTKSPQIMAKLMIGAGGDKYEQEADWVADQVVNRINMQTKDDAANLMNSSIVQRPFGSSGKASIQRAISVHGQQLQGANTLLTTAHIRQRMSSYAFAGYSGAGQFSDQEITSAINGLNQQNAAFISTYDYLDALDNQVGRIVFTNKEQPGINRIRALMNYSGYDGYQGNGNVHNFEIIEASNNFANHVNVRFSNKSLFNSYVENAVFTRRKEIYRGKTDPGSINFNNIPNNFQVGLRDIINGHNVNLYFRQQHTTNPLKSINSTNRREYHLDAFQNGRATSCVVNGVRCFYYSTSHAAGTYNYHLILMNQKPVMRGGINARFQVPV